MNTIYEVNFAGFPVYYSFVYPKTYIMFRKNIKPSCSDKYDIRSTKDRIERARNVLPPGSKNEYIEYRTLIGLTSRELLKYQCCIFHCVSFIYKGYAWLLTAPSGTGKTTQYFNWTKLFPDEITMISGDMPVLRFTDKNKIIVNPSPWNGKENIGNQFSAELGGVIYLKQGSENQISPLLIKDELLNIYSQFIVLPDTEDEILALAKIMECMLSNYPIMTFINTGDDNSTGLLRAMINRILEGIHES